MPNKMINKFFKVVGLTAMLGLFASTAQALPIYMQVNGADANGNVTMWSGDTLTVNMLIDSAGLPFTGQGAIDYYGFDVTLDAGLTLGSVSGNSLYQTSGFSMLNTAYEFIPLDPANLAIAGSGGTLPDVLLASFDLVASTLGNFTFDVNGGVFFGEPIASLFQVGNALNITVVPEPGTWLLLATGLFGMIFWARRKRATSDI